jgi:precorrin-8X/cobalt-precorrin-8 methylmutase
MRRYNGAMVNPLSRTLQPACDLRLPSDCGVLLVGHGTRDAQGQAEFLHAAAMLQAALRPALVEACSLELASPDVTAGVAALAARGASSLTVLPALLFEAAHAKRDIPEQIAVAVAQHGGMPWRMAAPLDCHAQVLELSARRFCEALAPHAQIALDETLLVMVGRGTSDPHAIARMRESTAARAALTPVAQSLACFLTGATPTLHEALKIAATGPWRNIVVQPHLLFHGQLVDDIHNTVVQLAKHERDSQRHPGSKHWIVTPHLGAAPELIAALIDKLAHVSRG